MSRNYVRCEACKRDLVKRHHRGRVRFLVDATPRPEGGWLLACPCGNVQPWFAREVDRLK